MSDRSQIGPQQPRRRRLRHVPLAWLICGLTLGGVAYGVAADSPLGASLPSGPRPNIDALSTQNFEAYRDFDPASPDTPPKGGSDDTPRGRGGSLQAWVLFRNQAERGDPYGELQFGLLLFREAVPDAPQRAGAIPLIRSILNTPEERAELDRQVKAGFVQPADPQQAVLWLKRSAAKGVPVADFYLSLAADPAQPLSHALSASDDLARRPPVAPTPPTHLLLQWAHPATWRMDPEALAAYFADVQARQPIVATATVLEPKRLSDLGRALWIAGGVDGDDSKGLWLIAQAANAGDPGAMATLGDIAATFGAPSAARDWYGKAARNGDAYGAERLAYLLRDGLGGDRDLPGAEKWLAAAGDKGDGDADYALAWEIDQRSGASRDASRVAKLYQRAADAGSAEALAAQGDQFENQGLHDKAIALWTRAVDLGSGAAATRLARNALASQTNDGFVKAFQALRVAVRLNDEAALALLESDPRFGAPYLATTEDLVSTPYIYKCGFERLSRPSVLGLERRSIVITTRDALSHNTCDFTGVGTAREVTQDPVVIPRGSVLSVHYKTILTASGNLVLWVRRLDLAKGRFERGRCIYIVTPKLATQWNSGLIGKSQAFDLQLADSDDTGSFELKSVPDPMMSYKTCAAMESGRM